MRKTCCDICITYQRAREFVASQFNVPVPSYSLLARWGGLCDDFTGDAKLCCDTIVAYSNMELIGREFQEDDDLEYEAWLARRQAAGAEGL